MSTQDNKSNSIWRPSRRQVLRAAAVATTAGLASRFGLSGIAHAQATSSNQRRFIFLYVGGGWDQLLFLDPRDPEADGRRFDDSNRATTLTETRYAQLENYNGFSSRVIRAGNLTFGPASEKPMTTVPKISQFSDKIAIIRGVNMNTLGHEVGYRYFLTGKFPAGNAARGTSVATELAGQMGSTVPLPVVSLNVEAYNDRQPGRYSAMRVASIDDLLLVLQRGREFMERDSIEAALDDYAREGQSCEVEVFDRRGLLTRMRDSDTATRDLLTQNLADRFRFVNGNDEASAAVRAQYNINRGDAGSSGARVALVAQAIKQGIAQCVSASIGGGLDTHFNNNQQHADRIYPSIAAVAALLDDLSRSDAPESLQRVGGRKWIDHTTIFMFSEFARTPMFNQFGGRDHHLSSSCMLAGAGIRGNTVIGESSGVGMGVTRWNFTTNRPTPDGENILPDHIAATLMASAGLDPGITRVSPITGLL